MSETVVKAWPKRLMDLGRARCRAKRAFANGQMRVPAGALGYVRGYRRWSELEFEGDACPCCGVAARVARLSPKDLELLDEAML